MTEQAKSILGLDELISDDELNGAETQDDTLNDLEVDKNSFIEDIAGFINCLMDLIPTFERIDQARPSRKQTERSPTLEVFDVTEPAHVYVRQILDRFPNAQVRLAERLGEANWQRHNEICRRMDDGLEESESNLNNRFVAKSRFHDSGLGTSVPAESTYAMTTASKASFASSLAEREQGSLRVPPTPVEVANKIPFTCSICHQTVHNIRDRRDWK